ncbi:hypothetical protein MNBD_BACTEROID07-860 [hydrothermal vent metagenome]|uniref:Uncharacterized protein n=1 Tax=hydrothermal vent metagenome TaxID=652676 RepID=A0A3B0V8C4_9ZZZZ
MFYGFVSLAGRRRVACGLVGLVRLVFLPLPSLAVRDSLSRGGLFLPLPPPEGDTPLPPIGLRTPPPAGDIRNNAVISNPVG